ncbi:hypothetical protein [Lysobacter gummosus]|uniref:hypothetical protein n=1 Tax=Lysobacter gummosus TaxID=262324 RepID=UPI0036396095
MVLTQPHKVTVWPISASSTRPQKWVRMEAPIGGSVNRGGCSRRMDRAAAGSRAGSPHRPGAGTGHSRAPAAHRGFGRSFGRAFKLGLFHPLQRSEPKASGLKALPQKTQAVSGDVECRLATMRFVGAALAASLRVLARHER